ncbi:MAG: DegT/DnrJ/EryC1/StrS family aminotransferase [Minicystis sp.]
MVIPFLDLKAQHRALKSELMEAASRVLDSGTFTLGEEVAAFEEDFATFCDVAYAAGTNAGTSALHVALLAADVGPGDEVITVPHTFIATASAIRYTGARPVFVDVDPVTHTMNPALIEAAITDRTKAIVPVHLYGQPADMDPIMRIAAMHGLYVIEDACQAHGAEYKGRRVGSIGHMGAFSFYPTKNLGACGEGGAFVTSDPGLIKRARMFRNCGQEKRYHHVLPSYNYRMDALQGAFLRVKLRHLPAWIEARRAHAARYDELFAGSGLRTPVARPYSKHVYHVYALMAEDRDALQEELEDQGIMTGCHYPLPVHLQGCFGYLGHRAGDFPHAERAAAQEISLPMFAELTDEEIEKVAEAVMASLGRATRPDGLAAFNVARAAPAAPGSPPPAAGSLGSMHGPASPSP